MHDTPIRVDHVGIAVASVADAEPILTALGCEKLADRDGPQGRFRWVYYRLGDASPIELVAPLDPDGDIAAFAAASNSHGETAVALETNVSYLQTDDVGETHTATAKETHLTDSTVVTDGEEDRVATFRGRVYRP